MLSTDIKLMVPIPGKASDVQMGMVYAQTRGGRLLVINCNTQVKSKYNVEEVINWGTFEPIYTCWGLIRYCKNQLK